MSDTTYTLDTMPLRKIHYHTFVYELLNFFICGFVIGLISIALPYAIEEFQMSAFWQGYIGSSILIGILIGALILGKLVDSLGRRIMTFVSLIGMIVFSLAAFVTNSSVVLFIIRLGCGFMVGIQLSSCCAHLTETIPNRIRGIWLAAMIGSWGVGGFMANLCTYGLSLAAAPSWRLMLAIGAIPSVISLLVGLKVPESLKWMIQKGKIEDAKETCKKYYGEDITIDDQVEHLTRKTEVKQKGSYAAVLTGKALKRTLFGGLFWICQLVPYYAIATYTPTVMSTMGVGDGNMGTVIMNLFCLSGGILGLIIMDKFPRKKFLIVTMLITFVPLVILGVASNLNGVLVTIFFGIAMFFLYCSMDLQNVYPPELFPTRTRGTGVGVISSMSRIGGILGAFAFPAMMSAFGITTSILICAAFCILCVIFTITMGVETRGKDLEVLYADEA